MSKHEFIFFSGELNVDVCLIPSEITFKYIFGGNEYYLPVWSARTFRSEPNLTESGCLSVLV